VGHIEAEREIAATPEALWAIVSDVRSWERWFTVHAGWAAEPPAEVAKGTTITEKIEMLGIANKIDWTVLDLQPPTKITMVGTGRAEVKVQFTFAVEPADTGTKLTLSGNFDGALINGALVKAVERDGIVQLDTTLRRLDEVARAPACA
jgi:carbon monoxide dehydrogenase subunit G